jgi:hypothetical protein
MDAGRRGNWAAAGRQFPRAGRQFPGPGAQFPGPGPVLAEIRRLAEENPSSGDG